MLLNDDSYNSPVEWYFMWLHKP
ncbi:BnaCnng25260D [Brassica napus]|uniref:BnaCnng25260D protein n=1 Tax=Brassica napus TaxID=3708 RepID=A0A078IVU5_BRANA|nr:BnaCnng25260D [Brassica napus]